MSGLPVFLSVENILAIHRRMIDEFRGDEGVRDHGLLESAVMMPSARFGGRFLHEGLPAMAAAYMFHICMNHPFVDGNKRTAVAAAEVFLLINDMILSASNEELEYLTIGMAEGRITKDETIEFFIRHVTEGGDSIKSK